MTIDPVTVTAAATPFIAKTTSWLWDKYGKDLLSRLGQEGKKEWDQRKWKKLAEKYLTNLYDDVSTLRVLGKSENQSIEQMYTDVNVLGKLSAEQRLKLAQLPDEYEERVGLRWQQKERQDGLKLARDTKRLFILGKPGAGKTTFLKHVTLQTIKGQMGEKIPIFISLWRLADSGQALLPYIVDQFRLCDFPEAEPFVRAVLKDGRALVLFDGLDEVRVENDQRDKLMTAVEDFGREFRDSQVFITCRLAVTDYTFDGYKYVEMADFDLKQMQSFVFRWFQEDVEQRNACWEALQADRNKTLRELARVPLLLSLLCLTYEKRNEFPQERDEIYKEATDALLNDWDASRRIKRGRQFIQENAVYENLTLKHKQKLLAHVAAQTFADGQYFVEEEKLTGILEAFLCGVPGLQDKAVDGMAVLRAMESQHGIFVERAHRIHSFSHLTLQEYYAARYIVENEASGTLPRLMSHVGEARWREVILLTASMLSDATSFFDLYLHAMQKMAASDKDLVAILQWGYMKSTENGSLSPIPRAYYLYINRDSDRYLSPELARILTLDLTLDRSLARSLAIADTYNVNLGRNAKLEIDRSLSLILPLVLAQMLDHTRTPYPFLALDYLLNIFLFVVQILAKTGAQVVDDQVVLEFQKTIAQLRQFCRDTNLGDLQVALAALPLPTLDASSTELKTFSTQLAEIARIYRNLGYEWNLSREQVALIRKYLQANLLFVDCLNLAYVPDRAAIENQILLPPGMS